MTAHAQHDPGSGHVHHGLHDRLLGRLTERARRAHGGMFGLARHADWYDGVPGRLGRPLHRRIAEDVAAAELPDGAVVVDVGTGPGRVPLLVAERCPTLMVEGVDLSEQMIARATEAAAEAGVTQEHVTFRVADVAALPHPDRSVDLVVSSLSLHHWADVSAGLSEIRRVLRPGGSAWIYDFRGILDRAATTAAHHDLDVTLEPLRRAEPRRLGWAQLLGMAGGRLLGRLTVRAE